MTPFETLSDIHTAILSAEGQWNSPMEQVTDEFQLSMVTTARNKLPDRIAFLRATLAEGLSRYGAQLTAEQRAALSV